MSAATANYFSMSDPNYRRFDLPWTRETEEYTRLRKISLGVMGTLFVMSVIIPFLPVSDIERNAATDIPPRLAKLVIEKKALPPPPPPPEPEVEKQEVAKPKPEPKPEPIPEVKPPPRVAKVITPPPEPVIEPVVPPEPSREEVVEKAREKAKTVGLMAVADDLADLRQNSAVANTTGSNLSASVSNSDRTERALITSRSSKRSAGVNTSNISRSTGGGGLAGRTTTAVAAPVHPGAKTALASAGSSGSQYAGQRSQEEIETIFDKNKAAIYALYRRALRKDPTLQGKLVLELTIAPSGKVVAVSVVSSELGSTDFEKNLLRRVKMFDFGAQDVDEVTTTKPIDFFPA